MVKTTIRQKQGISDKILFEFDEHLSEDCVKNYNYRDKNGNNFFANKHIIIDIVEELEEIIYYVISKLTHENVTMVYIQNWTQWTEEALKNWHKNAPNIDIALVSFLVPYIGLEWPKKQLCPNVVASVPEYVGTDSQWSNHGEFITTLKENNPNLKVLISYGGAGLGCCPGDTPETQNVNFLAEQIKYYIDINNLEQKYITGNGGRPESVSSFLSYDIAEFVVSPDTKNTDNIALSKETEYLVYDIVKAYTTSNVKGNKIQQDAANSNMDNYLQLTETESSSCTVDGRQPMPKNLPIGSACEYIDTDLEDQCNKYYDAVTGNLCQLNEDKTECIQGDKCSLPPSYDGIDFDYEIDYDFTHMVYALTHKANKTGPEAPPAISDKFANDLSNIIIKVMDKVDELLNRHQKGYEEGVRTKIISTVPFVSHFDGENAFNKALRDISNIY